VLTFLLLLLPLPLQNQYSGTSFSIVTLTPKGAQLLCGRPARLCLLLPAHLEAEDARQRQREQKEAAERQRREAVQQAKHEEAAEKEQLLAELKRVRKATADALGQVRKVQDTVCSGRCCQCVGCFAGLLMQQQCCRPHGADRFESTSPCFPSMSEPTTIIDHAQCGVTSTHPDNSLLR
jgi:hypothetical protein